MAKIKTKTNKTPSSKTDLAEVSDCDQTVEVSGVGKKGPSGGRGPSAEAIYGVGSGANCRGERGAAACGRKDADRRPNRWVGVNFLSP